MMGEKMDIRLGIRTAETVAIYFEKAQNPAIKALLPQKAKTLEEALSDYEQTLLPGAASYGRIILADGVYIGDVWCYCMDKNEEPNAMLSYCIFEEAYWSQGIATEAVGQFLREVRKKFALRSIGAFTFSENIASIRVLEKNGLVLKEEFMEDGKSSKYFQADFDE